MFRCLLLLWFLSETCEDDGMRTRNYDGIIRYRLRHRQCQRQRPCRRTDGDTNSDRLEQVYATGAVSGNKYIGGLSGRGKEGTITQAYATGTVKGDLYVGGLVGYIEEGTTIDQSYSTGTVTGNDNLGGLV